MSARDVAAQRLRAFLERIERLEEERKTLGDDIAEVYKELVDDGFDKDAAKIILKIRKAEDGLNTYTAKTGMVDVYLVALGMVPEIEPDRAPSRTREIIEEFDADTGEIIEPETRAATPKPSQVGAAPAGGLSADALATGPSIHEQPETANQAPMVVYGDSAEATAFQASLSKFHPAGNSEAKRDGVTLPPADTFSPSAALPPQPIAPEPPPQVTQGSGAPIQDESVPAFLQRDHDRARAA